MIQILVDGEHKAIPYKSYNEEVHKAVNGIIFEQPELKQPVVEAPKVEEVAMPEVVLVDEPIAEPTYEELKEIGWAKLDKDQRVIYKKYKDAEESKDLPQE